VSEITDKSGNGRTATQGAANNRPTYQSAARNGKNAARFDGSNDFLASSLTFAASPFTVLAVFARLAGKFHAIVAEAKSGSTGYFGATLFNSSVISISRVGVNGVASTLSVANDTAAVGVWTSAGISASEISVTVRRDGTANASALSLTGAPALPTDATGINLGGGNNGAADQWNGDICEVLVYGRQLSATEIATLERALAKKWGVTLA